MVHQVTLLLLDKKKKKNEPGRRKMPEGEMVQIVSLANHDLT